MKGLQFFFSLYFTVGACLILSPERLMAQSDHNKTILQETEQKYSSTPQPKNHCVRSEKIGAILIEGVVGLIGNYDFNEPDPDGTCFFVARYQYSMNKEGLASVSSFDFQPEISLLSISPNPAYECIHVKSCTNGSLTISDGVNKTLFRAELKKEEDTLINLSTIAAGILYLKLYDISGNLLATQKLIKNGL